MQFAPKQTAPSSSSAAPFCPPLRGIPSLEEAAHPGTWEQEARTSTERVLLRQKQSSP